MVFRKDKEAMNIWVNTMVHNEENFIWFALMSVIDYVDQILIYDTGSTDQTVQIIKEVQRKKKNKVRFQEVGTIAKDDFPKMRQKMLEESKSDWILVLDGDEVWWRNSIKKIIDTIQNKGNRIEGIVVPMVVPVGDIYHLQDNEAGQYRLLGRKGHLSLRAINKKIPGLHVDFPYGKESYLDENNKLIQERENIIFLNAPYLHVTHLKRSSLKRKNDKFKYELGSLVNSDFKFPEVLMNPYPKIVPSPWVKISGLSLVKAKLLTPVRKIKRKFL